MRCFQNRKNHYLQRMSKKLRVGTRDSQLAVWQAEHVCKLLAAKGVETEIIFIKSDGEFDLKTPLYEMGVKNWFFPLHGVSAPFRGRSADMGVYQRMRNF